MKLNTFFILSTIFLLSSCLSSKNGNSIKTDASAAKSKTGVIDPLLNIDTGLALKTFNQYNKTLAKATGIDQSTVSIATEYEAIKNSLPSDHIATTYTPFHQISQTRLSFAYCNNFIDTSTDFNSSIYTSAKASEEITTRLLVKFIGTKPLKDFDFYDKFHEIILNIMNNEAGLDSDGKSIGKLIPTATGAVAKKNLTKLACTAILSSAEFTTL
jgi:hypothetical protein